MKSKMTKTEGMKSTPAGGANRKPFGQNLMPTNAKAAMGGVKKMLSAIYHGGKPGKGSKMPFAK